MRALPLERKIQISQTRIIEWYQHYNGQVVVSFSGGKDSTVLLHLVRSIYPDVKAVFSNTGLEYPEIQRHVMSVDNVDIIRPSMRFDEVISTYGYPLIGKEVAEAIYYARRIRSQSGNVERERESRRRYSKTDDPSRQEEQLKRNELSGQRSRTKTNKPHAELQNGYKIGGGVQRPSECDRDSQCQTAEEYSHPDERCKKQTNSLDGTNERGRNRAGVVVKTVTIGGGTTTLSEETNVHTQPRTESASILEKNRAYGAETAETHESRTAQNQTSRDSTDWHNWRRGCL